MLNGMRNVRGKQWLNEHGQHNQNKTTECTLGDWRHGWQYHTNYNLEASIHNIRDIAQPRSRRSVASPGKGRLQSCMDPLAATELLVSPTTAALSIQKSELQYAVPAA
eukprot:6438707-Pyramimonas_sp.AAC.1